MTDYQLVPDVLRTVLKTIVIEQGFVENCDIDIENLDGENQVLNSAYSVVIQNRETMETDTEKCLILFVKCLVDKEENSFLTESRIFFNNEVVFYGEVLEGFKDLCRQHEEAMYRAAPKCYKWSQQPEISFVIMDNLFHLGFGPIDTSKPIPLSQAHQLLQELGKLHALSFVMKERLPLKFANAVDKIEETLFREDMRATFGKLFVHAIHDALKLAKNSLPPASIYTERLSHFTLNVFERMIKLAKGEDEDDYKVITHGDVRTGNILVKPGDETGNTSKICLLDYQACRYASPAHDLAFFLFMCLDKSTRDQHRQSLINTYHSTLCSTIHLLGLDSLRLFPMSALTQQLKKHAKFSVALALVGLPMYMDEGADPNDPNEESGEEFENLEPEIMLQAAKDARERKSMKCKNKMMEIIIDAVDQGWL